MYKEVKMQVTDNREQLIVSKDLDILTLPQELYKINLATVKKVIIAPLPQERDILEFNGLKFEVTRVLSRGRYIIRLMEAISDVK